MDKIDILRKEIDTIDNQIMTLLDKRYDLTKEIGIVKKQQETAVLDSNREEIIKNKIAKFSHYPQINAVYETIMSESRKQQGK